jgi:RNA polymerase sigma factor (sigma-70 family)
MTELIDLIRKYQAAKSWEEGEKWATEIYQLVAPELHAFIRGQCPPDDAADIEQETMLGIARGLARFRGKMNGQAWDFCYQVARHKLADYWRAHYRRRTVTLEQEELWRRVDAARDWEPLSPEQRGRLEHAMESLKCSNPKCFDLLWRRYIHGYTHAELGAAHNKSEHAARMAVNRCLEVARTLLELGD